MQSLMLMLAVLVITFSSLNTCISSPSYEPLDTLTLSKILNSPKGTWPENAFWPTKETIEAMKYIGDVTPEKDYLIKTLNAKVSADYRPSEKDLNNIIASSQLRHNNDYLLLRYMPASGAEVTIQDANHLYLTVALPKTTSLSEVDSLVKNTAGSVLNLTEVSPDNRKNPGIWKTYGDIGPSAFGKLRYGYSPKTEREDWYTDISWWSDGKHVMFSITKADMSIGSLARTSESVYPRFFKSSGRKVNICIDFGSSDYWLIKDVPKEFARFRSLRARSCNKETAEAAVAVIKATRPITREIGGKMLPSNTLESAWLIGIQTYKESSDPEIKSVIMNEWNDWMQDKPETYRAFAALRNEFDSSLLNDKFKSLFMKAESEELIFQIGGVLGEYGEDAEDKLLAEKVKALERLPDGKTKFSRQISNLLVARSRINWWRQGDVQRRGPYYNRWLKNDLPCWDETDNKSK